LVVLTLATADHEVLASPAESASDDKRALFLALEAPHDVHGLKVDKLDLSFREIDKHIPRILANGNRGRLALQDEAIFLFVGSEIVHMDFPLNICGDKPSPIRSDRTILDAEATGPHMEDLSAQTPVAELGTQVKGRRHKRLSVGSPGSGSNRLAVVIDGKDTATGLSPR
jgi:hypothetical protein